MLAPRYAQISRVGDQVAGTMLANRYEPIVLRDLDSGTQRVVHRVGQLALLFARAPGFQGKGDQWQASS
jgi:hypothetical protein